MFDQLKHCADMSEPCSLMNQPGQTRKMPQIQPARWFSQTPAGTEQLHCLLICAHDKWRHRPNSKKPILNAAI